MSRAQAKTYGSPAASRKAARVNRRDMAQARRRRMAEARRRFFPRDAAKALGHSERRAINNLASLRSQDPARYAENERRARRNIFEKANDTLISAASKAGRAVEHANDSTTPRGLRQVKKAGLGTGLSSSPAAKEIMDLAANTPSGLYLTGKAAVESGKETVKRGHPTLSKGAKKLWRDYKKTSAIPAAVSGDWKEAAKRATEHPVATALELSGFKAGVGRSVGAGVRAAGREGTGFRGALHRAGRTDRENLRLYPHAKRGEGPEIQRRYSKDIINKGVQVASEKIAKRRGHDPHVARGSHVAPGMPRRLGGSHEPGAPTNRLLVRRADTRVFAQTRVAQHRKANAEHVVRHTLKGSKVKGVGRTKLGRRKRVDTAPGIQLVAEGAVRIEKIRADLHKRKLTLAREYKKLTDPEWKRLNREEARHIRELENLSDEQLARMVGASEEFGKSQAGVQKRGLQAGTWDATGMSKRRYPFLQSHAKRPSRVLRKAYTAAERRAMDKALRRRWRRNKPLPDGAALKAMSLEREFEKAQAARRAPGAPLISAITDIALGKRPRPGRPVAIKAGDFEPYLKTLKPRKVRVGARSLSQKELALAAKTAERIARRRGEPFKGVIEGGPAMITQRPGARAGSMRLRPSAPFEPVRERSGKAFALGGREVGRPAMERQSVVSEAEVTAAEGHQLLDREFGVAAGDKGLRYAQTRDAALVKAREITQNADGTLKPGHEPLVPVNVAQFQTFGARLRAKQAGGMPRSYSSINDMERQALSDTWAAAMEESGRGKWILMPESLVQRLREHASVGTFGPMHGINNVFKDVVLTSSSPFRWIGGNITDITMRTAFAGITPLDILRGRKVSRAGEHLKLTAAERLQLEQAMASVMGGGLYHASSALDRSLRPRGHDEPLARTVLSAPWRAWKGAVYRFEHAIEELPQWGAVGKSMRRETGRSLHEADGAMKRDLKTLLKLHDEQIDHFAFKLGTDRAMEARIQKATEDVIGRWGKVSPNMRRALLIAPFAQWLGAATRYTFVTLPVHHPIKTGLIAGISEMTDKERRALGLSYFLPRDKQIQDYQMGSLPMDVGKNKYGPTVSGVRTSRMTSLGTAAQAAGGDVGSFLFPQFAGALDAWAGTSFTHEQLVYPDWWPEADKRRLPIPPDERQKIGIGALLEASIPFASAFRRAVLEKGRPAEPYSTILTPATRKKFDKQTKTFVENQGTQLGGILEWLSPVAPKQRLYTYGAGKAIEEQGVAGEVLDKWRKLPRKPREKKAENWWAPTPTPTPTPEPDSWFK